MCIIYMTFYTAFITKEHFQIFGEMVQKVLKMRKCNLFFYQICLHVGWQLRLMSQNSCGNSCVYNFYGICVLCKSPVLCGVVPRLYTQVSRAEVTTSRLDWCCILTGRKHDFTACKFAKNGLTVGIYHWWVGCHQKLSKLWPSPLVTTKMQNTCALNLL